MLSRMRQDSDNNLAKERAESLRRIECILDQPVCSDPMPVAHELRRGVWFVNFNTDRERDVSVSGIEVREYGLQGRAFFYGFRRVDVCICVVAAMVPEQEVAKQVRSNNVVWVGIVELLEVRDGGEHGGEEVVGLRICDELVLLVPSRKDVQETHCVFPFIIPVAEPDRVGTALFFRALSQPDLPDALFC